MKGWARQTVAAHPRRRVGVLVAILGLIGLFPALGQSDGVARDGMFLSVPSNITDGTVTQLETQVKDAILRQNRRISVVVFDFNPNGQPCAASNFHACNQMAEFILKLQRRQFEGFPAIKTVAFVHNEVKRHTILPVFACKELVMGTNGKLGSVMDEQPEPLSASALAAYDEVARTWSGAGVLVRKLLDKNMVIVRVKGKDGVLYMDKAAYELDAMKGGPPRIQGEAELVPELGAGSEGIPSKLARELGLCKRIFNTREQVAQGYGLPPLSLRENALAGRTPVVYRIDVRSPFDKARLDSLERRIKSAIGRGANFLFLNLDCEGGETVDAASTARLLRNLTDDSGGLPVKTVAYIPKGRSLGAATFLAVACSEIVMASDAVLGDFGYLKDAKNLDAPREMLVKLAREQGYPELLFQATLQPGMELFRAKSKVDLDQFRVVQQKELDGDWVQPARIPIAPDELFKIDARTAKEWGIARFDDVNDVNDLYARYKEQGVDPARVKVSRDDWLDEVAEFFREPIVNMILIVIGIAGLILELKMPGVTLPGILAAVCFVLFFWAHSFVGQFTILAVLLFVLGLILIGIEIFVVPGFGVPGISGLVLLIGSLVLAALERMPQTSGDWMGLGTSLTFHALYVVAALISAFAVAYFLPSIPYANRLVLNPPDDSEHETSSEVRASSFETSAALLGAIGVAATTLRPAGKVRFGDDYLDVIAEGDFVEPGQRVQVIEIEGNRIVVKEV